MRPHVDPLRSLAETLKPLNYRVKPIAVETISKWVV